MKIALTIALATTTMASCSTKSSKSDSIDSTNTLTLGSVMPLHVDGTTLLYENGDTAVLTGPSLGWHSNWARFYNTGTVKALKEKWGANITRAAIGAHASGDITGTYDNDSTTAINLASTVIDAAIDNGMYIICDWHSHENTLDNAKKFFTTITEKYGDTPNIIYEIWDEPLEIPWQEIKDYATELIPVIRKNAPNSVIIVGTPKWDQDVDMAAESPQPFPNYIITQPHTKIGTVTMHSKPLKQDCL